MIRRNFMGRKFRLSTALDIDDVLMECTAYAVQCANEKYKFDPPLSIYEIKQWGKQGTRSDIIFEFFNDPEFYRTQPVYEGAKEFVRKLSTMTEVFIKMKLDILSVTPNSIFEIREKVIEIE